MARGLSRDLRRVIGGLRGVHEDELVELRSLRERYARQLEHYQEIPGGEHPPPVRDPGQAAALEDAWRVCQAAYCVWRGTYDRWEALRRGH